MVDQDYQETSANQFIPHPLLERIAQRVFDDDQLGPEHYFAIIEGLQEIRRSTAGDVVAYALGTGQADVWALFGIQLGRFVDKLCEPLDPEAPRAAKIQRFSVNTVRSKDITI